MSNLSLDMKDSQIVNDLVEKRSSILPIIGDDMIVYVDKEASKEIPFQTFIVNKFLEKYPSYSIDIDTTISMKEKGYYGLTLLSQTFNERYSDDFVSFVKHNSNNIRLRTDVLNYLVVNNFPIIITTSCFDVIERCLGEIIEKYQSQWYQLNKDNRNLPSRCVYHIFGQANDGTKWVYDEDRLLAFLLSHNDKDFGAKGLTEHIRENEKRLLALGCNLPNWLFRFFLNPVNPTKGFWINKDKLEDSFENFLNRRKYYSDKKVSEILVAATSLLQEELEEDTNLKEKNGKEEKFDVFISYASEDRLIATQIYEALKKINVDAWFDDRGKGEINPGDHYWEKIKKGIMSSAHYMPIITGNWVNKLTCSSSLKEETYLVSEWQKNPSIALGDSYSIPVIVTESYHGDAKITLGFIEQLAALNVLPKSLFYKIDMIEFNGSDFNMFEKVKW